jgi:reverse gyrase
MSEENNLTWADIEKAIEVEKKIRPKPPFLEDDVARYAVRELCMEAKKDEL